MITQYFKVFSPKIFGGINMLNNVLLDRSILIQAHRAPKEVVKEMPKMNQEFMKWQSRAAEIRNRIYIWALTRFHLVKDIFMDYPASEEVFNREWEIWLPLLTIAYLADYENGVTESGQFEGSYTQRLNDYAVEKAAEKHVLDQENTIEHPVLEALLGVIQFGEVVQIYEHPKWYVIRDAAKQVTEYLRENGVYSQEWTISSRKLTQILENTQVIQRSKHVKAVKYGGKTVKAVYLDIGRIESAMASL